LYGVGFANNGGGSDGIEFTFPSQSAAAGTFLTIASEEIEFQAYFGELPDFVDGSAIINGDDTIELFFNGEVVDVYGNVNVAGGDWNYMDGWSYRHDASTPSAEFNIADWTLSGINAVDSCTSNAACASVFPLHSYKHSTVTTPLPTSQPTPNPTDTATSPKSVCTKEQPLPATICAEGSPADESCSNENSSDSCGKGGKVCWWNACPSGGSSPAPTPPAPTPSNCTPNGSFCNVDSDCCNGSCPTKGKNPYTCK
jgi:hypothetical protein